MYIRPNQLVHFSQIGPCQCIFKVIDKVTFIAVPNWNLLEHKPCNYCISTDPNIYKGNRYGYENEKSLSPIPIQIIMSFTP